jgi:hypothetical protein
MTNANTQENSNISWRNLATIASPQTYGVPFRQVPELGTGLLVPCRRARFLGFDRVVIIAHRWWGPGIQCFLWLPRAPSITPHRLKPSRHDASPVRLHRTVPAIGGQRAALGSRLAPRDHHAPAYECCASAWQSHGYLGRTVVGPLGGTSLESNWLTLCVVRLVSESTAHRERDG